MATAAAEARGARRARRAGAAGCAGRTRAASAPAVRARRSRRRGAGRTGRARAGRTMGPTARVRAIARRAGAGRTGAGSSARSGASAGTRAMVPAAVMRTVVRRAGACRTRGRARIMLPTTLAVVRTVVVAVPAMLAVRGVAVVVAAAPVVAAIAATVTTIGIAMIATAVPAVMIPRAFTAVGATPLLATIPGLLAVVAVAGDLAALAIGHAVDAGTLLRSDVTIGLGLALGAIDVALALFETTCLATRDLTVADAMIDTILLDFLTLVDVVHRLRVRAAARGKNAGRRQHGVRDKAKFCHLFLWAFFDGTSPSCKSLRTSLPQTSLKHPSNYSANSDRSLRP